MSTQLNTSSTVKQVEYVTNAAGMGLFWGLMRGTMALLKGESASEIVRVASRSASSAAAATYVGQVTVEQSQEMGLDSESSLIAGMVTGLATKFGTRAVFDVVVPQNNKEEMGNESM
ncbi:MAG: hypothetical protein R3C14_34530 [Caldilineaceae bacterium]